MTPTRVPKFNVLNAAICVVWAMVALGLTMLVCSSVFFFNGSKVDESEVVLNALAIAAGDWSPKWSPGYGHLAMYLPAAAMAMTSLFLQATGAATGYADALYLLFQDGAVYRITRFFYALADVGTTLVFARMIVRATGMRLVAAASVLYFMLSPDTWQYADYVRTDTLVSLFTAMAAYVLVRPRTKATPYLLGIAIGAAIACKYSAVGYMALSALLLFSDPDQPSTLRQRVAAMAIACVAACIATFVFQPRFDYSGIVSAVQLHLSGTKFVHEAQPIGERMVRLWAMVKGLEPFALLFLVSMWLGLSQPRRYAPLLLVVIGIVPFALSNFPRDYWLIPFADALRAAGWLGIAYGMRAISRRSTGLSRVTAVGVLVAIVAIAIIRLPDLQHSRRDPNRTTNEESAKRWLYGNVANRERLVYAYEKNYLLPRAYSFSDYTAAADFSRIFIFHREGFESLHGMFRKFLYTKEYADFTSSGSVPPLWLRVNTSGSGSQPRLCVGGKCYPPKKMPCDAMANTAGVCSRYVWNMGRPEFRVSLSRMSLELAPNVHALGLCWYNCRPGALVTSVDAAERGNVPLVDLSKHLFAPAEVRSLTEIRRMSVKGGRLFVVTTPKAYEPWIAGAGVSVGNRKKGSAFERMIGARLVQRFHEGRGPVIEIYEKLPAKNHPRD